MKLYSSIVVLVMGSFVLGCVPSTTDDLSFSANAAGGSGGSGNSCNGLDQCVKPKQIRLLDAVTVFDKPIEIRYDSLDRLEPRELGTKMPITKLEAGDVVHIDPIDPFVEETILVKAAGTAKDQTGETRRSLIAVFKTPHIVNAPGTTPIEDGCPEFIMPVQDVCDKHGQVRDLVGTCYKTMCMYGELVLIVKPDGSPCGASGNLIDFDGHCRTVGYTMGICDPNP